MVSFELPDDPIERLRRFDRFYARRLQRLEDRPRACESSVAHFAVLRELAMAQEPLRPSNLGGRLDMDSAQVCRTLQKLGGLGYVIRNEPKGGDRRRRTYRITVRGCGAFRKDEQLMQEEATTALAMLGTRQRAQLANAMRTIEELLSPGPVALFLARYERTRARRLKRESLLRDVP